MNSGKSKKIYPDCMSESKCQNSVKACFLIKKEKVR